MIGPDGRWIAGPLLGEEGIVTAEIDLADLDGYRAVRDAVDGYGRPDLFRLLVNVTPQRIRGAALADVPDADWRVYA